MFDWVPIFSYTPFFDLAILFFIAFIFLLCQAETVFKNDVVSATSILGIISISFLVLYMGLRPISAVFGDTMNYAEGFYETAMSRKPFQWEWNGEWLYYNLQNWFAKYSDIHSFFLLCAALYILPLWLASYRIFKKYYFIPILVIFCMFTFWNYGVNGIRNGIGASIFILAMTYPNNIPVMLGLVFLALGFHNSVLLMFGAALAAWFYKNSYVYIGVWFLCVVLSYFAGDGIQAYIAASGILGEDERLSGYLTGDNMIGEVIQMDMVFRWDFLLYSFLGIGTGAYFVLRKRYLDEYYLWIYNTYLLTNAFWVLVIRAAYSNRFAQISWFILPLVLIYPFMKKRFWPNHEQMLGYALLVFYAFTFYFNIVSTNTLSLLF